LFAMKRRCAALPSPRSAATDHCLVPQAGAGAKFRKCEWRILGCRCNQCATQTRVFIIKCLECPAKYGYKGDWCRAKKISHSRRGSQETTDEARLTLFHLCSSASPMDG